MLRFDNIDKSDFPVLRRFYEQYGNWSCDCTILGIYMWKDYLNIRMAENEDALYLWQQLDGKDLFYVPLTADRERAIDDIYEFMQKQGRDCYFYPVTSEELKWFENRGYEVEIVSNPSWDDYVYRMEDLAGMRGKKYHKHRNHVNRFDSLYPGAELVELTSIPSETYLKFLKEYIENEKEIKTSVIALEENEKSLEILSSYEDYPVIGYALMYQGEMIGLEVGEIFGDFYYSSIEKANKDYEGVYSKLVNLVAQTMRDRAVYMNREEDLGDPGLRHSKQSYRPCKMIEKNQIRITKRILPHSKQ